MNARIIVILLIIGILIGPYYSLSQYSQNQINPNDKATTVSIDTLRFIDEKNTYFIELPPSSFSIYNNTIFALEDPYQGLININQGLINISYKNFVQDKKFELLEVNMSTDFQSILSSKTYLLNSLPTSNLYSFGNNNAYTDYATNKTYFDKPIYNGSSFWTVEHEIYVDKGLYNSKLSILSFNKQGTILSKHILKTNDNVYIDPYTISTPYEMSFLGFYKNYMIIEDSIHTALLFYSTSNYTKLFSISFGSLIKENTNYLIGFSPMNYAQDLQNMNIDDNGHLWIHSYSGNSEYFLALSLSDIIVQHTSTIKEKIPLTSLVGHSGSSFNGYPLGGQTRWTTDVIVNNTLISLQFLSSTYNAINYVFTGVSVNQLTYHQNTLKIQPQLIVIFAGYGTIICTMVYIIYSKYLRKYIIK